MQTQQIKDDSKPNSLQMVANPHILKKKKTKKKQTNKKKKQTKQKTKNKKQKTKNQNPIYASNSSSKTKIEIRNLT